MLDPKTLEQIKQTSTAAQQVPKVIAIEIGIGFRFGKVVVGSPTEKELIKDLSTQLEWDYKEGGTTDVEVMYRTLCEFKNPEDAVSVGDAIKRDLTSKGYQIKSKDKTYQ